VSELDRDGMQYLCPLQVKIQKNVYVLSTVLIRDAILLIFASGKLNFQGYVIEEISF
jgi:hypothetical protein